MHEDPDENARTQNGMRDARTHVNRQKGRHGIETPRTVAEQVDELITVGPDGQRRRDPVHAAEAQHTERDNGVGGAWIDRSQRANAIPVDEAYYEKMPGRHEEKAERRAFDEDQ
ncbi:MAG: hypothetical protein JWM86_304 [Thermoleophilia bacterium]|nr:hypothetical protein [Thermoleophilia bacterium]